MTVLLLVLGFIGLDLIFRRRPVVVLALAVALLLLVPSQVSVAVSPFMHPVGYLLTAHLLGRLVRGDAWLRVTMSRYEVLLGVVLALTSYTLVDVLGGGSSLPSVMAVLTQVLLAPLILFLLVIAELRARPEGMRLLLRTLFALGVLQVVLAHLQVQSRGQVGYLWEEYYRQSWFWSPDSYFAVGSTGHPLQLGLLLAQLVPLLTRLPALWLRYALAIVYLYGVALSAGRVAFLLSLVGIVYLVAASSGRRLLNLALLVVATPVAVMVARGDAFVAIRAKFESDQGSAELRRYALDWALQHREEFTFFGYPGARDLRAAGQLDSSLENAYLMTGLEFGLVFAALLAVLHLSLVLVPALQWRPGVVGLVLACLFALVGFNASSSFMGGGIDGTMFFVFLAMLHASALPRQAPLRTATRAESWTQSRALPATVDRS